VSETYKKYEDLESDIQVVNNSETSLREKYIQLKRILDRNCKEITKEDTLQFPSLFSRLVYITQKYNLPQSLEWQLQNIRVKASFLIKNENNLISEKQYKKALENILLFGSIIYNKGTSEKSSQDKINIQTQNTELAKDCIRIQVIDIDKENELIIGKVDYITSSTISIKYNISKVNDIFNTTIERLWINAQINLIDSKIDNSGYYIPKFIVLEPDYLIDASSIAECFQNYGRSHLHYFRRKFESIPNSQYILLGNLANFFLDEFIFSDIPADLNFNDTFLKAFKQKPFEFTSCNDIKQVSDFKAFMAKAKTQFENIKRVVANDLPKKNIDIEKCTLEPSFFCERFGFQGRLDLLQLSDKENQSHQIIELKSGGLPYPKEDNSKISINHEVQTAIYRLIISSVFKESNKKISSAILYSAAENQGENLRYAASYQTLEKEIINIRNLIIATEHDLYLGNSEDVEKLFSQIFNIDNYGRSPQFFIDQIASIEKVICNLTDLEKAYLYRFITFISRELYIQKIGDDYFESNSSTASLWNTEFIERQQAFELISDLSIEKIDDTGRDMQILFHRKETTDFINFREGELCILYPHEKDSDTVLTNQILKGTIEKISEKNILLRFRYKQKNKSFFKKYDSWAVEHDRLDHAYTNMYKGLFSFFQSPINKRQVLLGLQKPISKHTYISENKIFTKEDKQEYIIQKAISAQDYFLIVGPPGTGKTSIFARKLIEHYYNSTTDNILIIAYTNRAVDELCEAINQAFMSNNQYNNQYIRIGTEFSCGENYRHRLLQNIANDVKSREELRNLVQKQRIFIGTLASITGKPELFDIKKFNIAIIDEASQILEPQIIGLLPQVDKFIMIGDHKQLSTISLQDKNKSKIDNPLLNIIKLYDCSESLFERLFRICQTNEWDTAYDTLVYQGRMHEELAKFPNEYFYNNLLISANGWQSKPLNINTINNNIYPKLVSEKRLAFINCMDTNDSISDKVNYKEAEIAVQIANAIIEIYRENNLTFDTHKTLGIITPYRNQIALIKHKLKKTGISELENIMIDTVERYQGSQRDIIILSFCINKPYQLEFFCNLNAEKTVDRKLNVALTRARQQLFLIGNEYILKQNPIYRKLLNNISTL
jgi:DNA replication ATP-dependent helicase Dna2